jgi:hypothetical protein
MLENPEIEKKDSMIVTLVGINVNQLDGQSLSKMLRKKKQDESMDTEEAKV